MLYKVYIFFLRKKNNEFEHKAFEIIIKFSKVLCYIEICRCSPGKRNLDKYYALRTFFEKKKKLIIIHSTYTN